MAILVTGGTGFIGSYVARRLIEAEERVVLFDYDPDASRLAGLGEDVIVVEGDVRDGPAVADVLDGHDVDAIIHLAALLTESVRRRPVDGVGVNALATARLLDRAAEAGVSRFVLASSIAAYGFYDPSEPVTVTEASPIRPTNLYGSCKVLSEHLGRLYAAEREVDVVALRFGTVFGPGRESGSSAFTSTLVEAPVAGEPVTVPGRGRTLSWLYVKDAARAVHAGVTREAAGFGLYNVHTEVATMDRACRAVESAVDGAEITLTEAPDDGAPWCWPQMDIGQAARDLGYSPAFDVETAVGDYVRELGGD